MPEPETIYQPEIKTKDAWAVVSERDGERVVVCSTKGAADAEAKRLKGQQQENHDKADVHLNKDGEIEVELPLPPNAPEGALPIIANSGEYAGTSTYTVEKIAVADRGEE